jgi:hypothetical protein
MKVLVTDGHSYWFEERKWWQIFKPTKVPFDPSKIPEGVSIDMREKTNEPD